MHYSNLLPSNDVAGKILNDIDHPAGLFNRQKMFYKPISGDFSVFDRISLKLRPQYVVSQANWREASFSYSKQGAAKLLSTCAHLPADEWLAQQRSIAARRRANTENIKGNALKMFELKNSKEPRIQAIYESDLDNPRRPQVEGYNDDYNKTHRVVLQAPRNASQDACDEFLRSAVSLASS